MEAFHNDEKIKKKYLGRVAAHRKADELVQGATGQNGKGCAVWCTLNEYNHKAYETELGIPEWLARLEDTIFEGLPVKRAMKWPEEFLRAIKPGSNLETVKAQFMIFILESSLASMRAAKYDADKFPDVKKAIAGSEAAVQTVIELWKKGEPIDEAAARSAAAAARSAAAWSAAAWSAAYVKFADKLLELLKVTP